jgi:DNA-binding transcriptional ArsR family regulator
MNQLQDFMLSRVRVKVMELFFTHPDGIYYVREITREIKEEINAVRRELDRMTQTGLLRSESRGNRLYYSLNPRYFFYPELQQMVAKSTGLGKKVIKNRSRLGDLQFVMFSGKFIRKVRPRQDEVDLLVIGDVVLPELQTLVKEEEAQLGREMNYAVFSLDEFNFRKTRRDPFIMDILFGTRVMIIGSEDEFVERQLPGLT